VKQLAALAEEERVDLTIVGPERPLEAGIVNVFQTRALPIFGPTREAARIETSKRFAKDLMVKHGIPTARASHHSDAREAKLALSAFSAPVVIKASGLASGKGVVVAQSATEAERAIDAMLSDRIFGNAGREILIEEFMEGEELSLFVITDGETAIPLLPARDHKRLLDGDLGPNTGGMGAYAPAALGSPDMVREIMATVIGPTLAAMRQQGFPFRGLLYAGLMITSDGPKVVEFNCRFGDPETQVVLPLLETDLLEIAEACVKGTLTEVDIRWKNGAAVCVVLASKGYPEKVESGKLVKIEDLPDDMVCFHAGTKMENENIISSGGRVFGLTAWAGDIEKALNKVYSNVERISFEGMQYRKDIAYHALEGAK